MLAGVGQQLLGVLTAQNSDQRPSGAQLAKDFHPLVSPAHLRMQLSWPMRRLTSSG